MKKSFFLRIIVPAILAIALFVISFSVIFLPMFEKGMMDRKKEMIRELTNSAWSVLEEYHRQSVNDNLSEKEAKEVAVKRVRHIRYGDEGKDYFWLTDTQPEMIMHPYRPELNGQDLSDYADPQGTKLFVEAVEKVERKGEGYINYWWQWKDDSTKIVPKLSYVKAFQPWGWIIGTGIYLEDVKEELKALEGRLIRITLLIILLITVIIFYIARQSLNIEKSRLDAEEKLRQSRQKYKMLVDASTESTMMWLNSKLIYFNQLVLEQTGYSESQLLSKNIDELFVLHKELLSDRIKKIAQTGSVEASLQTAAGKEIEVVLTVSKVEINNQEGYIIVIKEVTRQLKREKSTRLLEEEIHESITMINIPVKHLIKEYETIDMDSTIQQAADKMIRKQKDIIFVTRQKQIVGVIEKETFAVNAIAGKLDFNTPVYSLMKSPVVYADRNILVYDALHKMKMENTNYLAINNEKKEFSGYVFYDDLLEIQYKNSLFIAREIEKVDNVDQLQSIYDKLPGMVALLMDSGIKADNITEITTNVADNITKRIVELAIEKTGVPPVPFSFITLGSEGRREQTLKTDQDNAIIYKGKKTKNVEQYFSNLAGCINEWLNHVGYEFCRGEVMAGNTKWCQPISTWKGYFKNWIENSDPESILDTSIFFDLRYVYGDKSLVDELKHEINKLADSKGVFFFHFAKAVQSFKPVSYSERQEMIDLKKAMVPVVGFARVYALQNKIDKTNTIARLESLNEYDFINKDFIKSLIYSYKFLLKLRFRAQTEKILSNENPDNQLAINELNEIEKTTLKASLSKIAELHAQLGFDFKQY